MKIRVTQTFRDDVAQLPDDIQKQVYQELGVWVLAKHAGQITRKFNDHKLHISKQQKHKYGAVRSFVTVNNYVALYSQHAVAGELHVDVLLHDKHDKTYIRLKKL